MAEAKQDEDKVLERLKKEAQAKAEQEQAQQNEGLPDGGWGWMVVFASLVCNIIVDGVCYSFGVFKEQYVEEFGATNEQTGWVGSLLAGCYLTVGRYQGRQAGCYLTVGRYQGRQAGCYLTVGRYQGRQAGCYLTVGRYQDRQAGC